MCHGHLGVWGFLKFFPEKGVSTGKRRALRPGKGQGPTWRLLPDPEREAEPERDADGRGAVPAAGDGAVAVARAAGPRGDGGGSAGVAARGGGDERPVRRCTNFGENQRRSGNSCELRFCDIRDVPATTLMADVAQAAFPLGVGGPSRGRGGEDN